MHRIMPFALFFLVIIFNPNSIIGQEGEILDDSHVVLYYFHGNLRCVNCYNIEKFSREIVEENFEDQLAVSKLVFKIINVGEKGNEHFVYDYQLYTKSLVLSLVRNGKEIKSKNLIKIWEYLNDRSKFHQYVRDEITSYLNDL